MTACHAWIQLVVTTVLFRGSNFLGSLSGLSLNDASLNERKFALGIAAGIICVFCPKPFLWARRSVTGLLGSILGLSLENR